MSSFKFNDYADLNDGEIKLVLYEKQQAPPDKDLLPQYHFNIYKLEGFEPVGKIRLRIGYTDAVVNYGGHIGFEIDEEYRGNRLAARACNLLKKVALDHEMEICWITCEPDNLPSRRTCEIIGATFVEIIDIPKDYEMYMRGNKQMCRYKWDIR